MRSIHLWLALAVLYGLLACGPGAHEAPRSGLPIPTHEATRPPPHGRPRQMRRSWTSFPSMTSRTSRMHGEGSSPAIRTSSSRGRPVAPRGTRGTTRSWRAKLPRASTPACGGRRSSTDPRSVRGDGRDPPGARLRPVEHVADPGEDRLDPRRPADLARDRGRGARLRPQAPRRPADRRGDLHPQPYRPLRRHAGGVLAEDDARGARASG